MHLNTFIEYFWNLLNSKWISEKQKLFVTCSDDRIVLLLKFTINMYSNVKKGRYNLKEASLFYIQNVSTENNSNKKHLCDVYSITFSSTNV